MPPFDIVTDNVLFGVDFVEASSNTSGVVPIPKYNNKVAPASLFDERSHAVVPAAVAAVTGYVLHRGLGALLPLNYDAASLGFPDDLDVAVNSPVFSLTVAAADTNSTSAPPTPAAVTLDLRQLELHNRSAPRCVWWERRAGRWSGAGCSLLRAADSDTTEESPSVVVCRCDHLTTFAVLTAVTAGAELTLARRAGAVEVVTYVALAVALALLLAALVVVCGLRRLHSNANAIHVNLTLSLLLYMAVFAAAGIDRVEPAAIICRATAILLHFFCLAAFAWLLVEALHLYRMLTEIRNVNEGSMKWYYVLGYVFPGIVVALSVGLQTSSFGAPGAGFCWVRATDPLVWSLAAPALAAVTAGGVLSLLAFRVSCNAKLAGDPEVCAARRRGQTGALLLLLLPGAATFALLAASPRYLTAAALPFHYLLAAFTLLTAAVLLAGYVLLSKQTRADLRYVWGRRGAAAASLDADSINTAGGGRNKSSLVYDHHGGGGGGDSSLEGGLNRIHVGISTESTTSRSTTDKSNQAMFPPPVSGHHRQGPADYSGGSSSLSASGGGPMYGFNPAAVPGSKSPVKKSVRITAPADSDSDSELSAMEHPDLDLASSHSSDSDDDQYSRHRRSPGSGGTWKNRHAGGPGDALAPPERVDSLPSSLQHQPFDI